MSASNANPAEPWKVAVIGGGLSGLSAAHRVGELCANEGRRLELTLFEAGSRVGGAIGTRQVGDYLVETGADSFITNKPWVVELSRRLGIEDRLIPTDDTFRRSLVLRDGKPVPVPDGFALLAPAKLWPVLSSPIFSLGGKLRLGLEYFIPRRTDADDESLASFVRRRFGQEALDRLIQPLVGGIYTSDPEKLSLQATLPRFIDMERKHRSLIRAMRVAPPDSAENGANASGARYGLFATFAGGMSELIDALRDEVARMGTIRLNTKVLAVQTNAGDVAGEGTWCLSLEDGSTEWYDAVILALPAYRVADMVGGTDAGLAEDLCRIEYASSAIVVTGHDLADVAHPLDAFGLVIPSIERRKILAVSFASRKFPGRAPDGRVQLRTFVGGALQPELLDLSDDEMISLVRDELHELLGVTGNQDFATVTRYVRAMPQYHVGHGELVGRIEERTAQHPGLELAGNAYHGVGVPDSIHSGETAAERLFAETQGTHESVEVRGAQR